MHPHHPLAGLIPQVYYCPNKDWSTAELVDYAFSELLAGVLEFEMQGEKQPKSKAPLSQNYPNAASIEVLEVEAR